MDTAVDDFLKEINELLPPKPKIIWKECFDESTGFSYYWNTETDEVTWEAPTEYKKQSKSGNNKLYIPPPSQPKFKLHTLPKVDEVNVKIYKINEACSDSLKSTDNDEHKNQKRKNHDHGDVDRKTHVKALIAYGSSSESDNEDLSPTSIVFAKPKDDTNLSEASDFEDEVDILTQIQKKANDLKKMGGELPVGVKKLIETPKSVSLVPGYGDDDDDDDNSQDEEESNKIKSLFPAADNIESNNKSMKLNLCEKNEAIESMGILSIASEIDAKAFQRKRRIGVSLVNTRKRGQNVENEVESDKKDFEKKDFEKFKKVEYPGFKSGGILFGGDTDDKTKFDDDKTKFDDNKTKLNDESYKNDGDEINGDESDKSLVKEIKDTRDTLEEKLKFLCEGHPAALPVQVMIIQMETLFTAMREHSLKSTYLKSWLTATLEDLTKLEKEAAPSGWLLQWDRAHKRYYYHNQSTGESQWDYPEADVIRTEEAMDISMTPPHETTHETNHEDVATANLRDSIEENNQTSPTSSSNVDKSLTPPPPPIISTNEVKDATSGEERSVQESAGASFSSELSSFYSDIAAMESTGPLQSDSKPSQDVNKVDVNFQPPKKKKKVKVSSGLAMKKKGVSQMVEKWKNLQKNYD